VCESGPRDVVSEESPALLFGRVYDRAPPAPGLILKLVKDFQRLGYGDGDAGCRRLAHLEADAAVFLAITGDAEGARKHLAGARKALHATGGGEFESLRLLEAAVALLLGDTGPIVALAHPEARAGGVEGLSGDVAILAWIAAASGQGSLSGRAPGVDENLWRLDLALPPKLGADAALGERFALEASAGFLPRVPHRMITGRAFALESLAAVAPDACTSCDPYRLAVDLARRRDLAAALGDQALAARFDAPVSALRAALSRRDLAVPLFALRAGG
jgi:hypothetical protein